MTAQLLYSPLAATAVQSAPYDQPAAAFSHQVYDRDCSAALLTTGFTAVQSAPYDQPAAALSHQVYDRDCSAALLTTGFTALPSDRCPAAPVVPERAYNCFQYQKVYC